MAYPHTSPEAVQLENIRNQIERVQRSLKRIDKRFQTELDSVEQRLNKERRKRPEVCQLIIAPIKELEEKAQSLKDDAPEKFEEVLKLAKQFQQAADNYFADPDARKAQEFFAACKEQADSCTKIDLIRCTDLERTIYRVLLAIGVVLSMGSLCLSPTIRGTLFYDATETRTKVNEVLETVKDIENLSLKVF